MPVTRGRDSHGPFYRYGKDVHPNKPAHGKKYYYTAGDAASRDAARAKAARQGRAIEASKARRDFGSQSQSRKGSGAALALATIIPGVPPL